MTKKTETVLEVENQETKVDGEKDLTSLDLLWKLGFNELDALTERFNKRDELFLEAVKNYVEKLKQNQENAITISAQFGMELKEWEKVSSRRITCDNNFSTELISSEII